MLIKLSCLCLCLKLKLKLKKKETQQGKSNQKCLMTEQKVAKNKIEVARASSSSCGVIKMAILGARAVGFSSFPSSSSYLSWNSRATSSSFTYTVPMQMVSRSIISRGCVTCSAGQESSSPTATAETKATTPAEAKPSSAVETKAAVPGEKEEAKAAPKAAPARPKPAAKAPAKPLPELMVEDVIPSLKTILEAQDDLSEIELSFQDNKLEGSFLKKSCPYSFWAFFPNGVLTGPKGFSLSSYGSGASTVEPFLIDEKKITAKQVVFWVEKRLAAQGIIPVWKKNDL